MERCGHCHAAARPVRCAQCQREMCVDCIGERGLCGLCIDENAEKADAWFAQICTGERTAIAGVEGQIE